MSKILIGDDALFMRATLKKMLVAAGHDVVGEAQNGKEVIQLYATLNPDLVLLDITMPEMNGLEALAELKRQYADARVIMCTALGQENKVREAITIGASDYLVKPVIAAKLIETVQRVLA